MERLRVDQDLCIGCGSCVNICDEIFDFSEEGITAIANEEKNILKNLNPEMKDCALDALDACPVSAIKLVEDEEDNEK